MEEYKCEAVVLAFAVGHISPLLSCRCRVSSPVWRSAAHRWGACRKLWKPSDWTAAGWTRTCLCSRNGSNTGALFSLCPWEAAGVFHQDNSSVCTIVGLCLSLPLHRPEYKSKPKVVLYLVGQGVSFSEIGPVSRYLLAQGGSDCVSDRKIHNTLRTLLCCRPNLSSAAVT